jgi:drug/metabolite transporter (DMT)-like permease
VPLFLLATGAIFLAARFWKAEVWRWEPSVAGLLVYASVFPSALGYCLWEAGMRRGSLPVLGAASYLLPVTSTLFTCWYLHVPATADLLIGSTVVVAGAVLSRKAIVEAPLSAR